VTHSSTPTTAPGLAAVLACPQLLEGRPEPLGSTPLPGGVNFAVWSDHAQRIELCVFSADGRTELRRWPLHGPFAGVFHGFLPGAAPGLVYGLRAHGPWAPDHGHRFNPAKLLLDPWGREIIAPTEGFAWREEHLGHAAHHTQQRDERDNAAWAHKSRVAAPAADAPGHLNRPHRAPHQRVLAEVHVKGFTAQHPDVPPALRGTYAGMAHPAAIAHWQRLGVTTLSLLPVQQCLSEPHLQPLGLPNYWGYNTLGFFSADPRWSTTPHDPRAAASEFRAMVASLHAAGLEVVLDVVYNHTPEGSEQGATLCWRGLDHRQWYAHETTAAAHDPTRLRNLTGCGNALNVAHPMVSRFVLDSLRYWVREMGVDGFRFDLAPVLGRDRSGRFNPEAAFFTALRQDPLLSQVLMIAEPWDASGDGYQLGQFPPPFMEWNDKFRDTMRGWWLNTAVNRGQMAQRFCASSTVFGPSQRRPSASINFIAVHDGFTTHDVVSYAGKHNEANGEGNRDGRDGELCQPFGPEGPSADPAVQQRRERTRRALLASLLLAHGTPMLCAGDELANSQGGNNNAYNQDNPTTWLEWAQADHGLMQFVVEVLALRQRLPALHTDLWPRPWHAADPAPQAASRVHWRHPAGHELNLHEWHHPAHSPGAAFAGVYTPPGHSQPTLLLAFNPDDEPCTLHLPDDALWRVALCSSGEPQPSAVRGTLHLPARSLRVAEHSTS
jgi:glycogen debranching enzyme GlgX